MNARAITTQTTTSKRQQHTRPSLHAQRGGKVKSGEVKQASQWAVSARHLQPSSLLEGKCAKSAGHSWLAAFFRVVA
jgi:hypothetical protein